VVRTASEEVPSPSPAAAAAAVSEALDKEEDEAGKCDGG